MFVPLLLLEVERFKKCTPLWREERFKVKMRKPHHARSTFGSWDVEKAQAVVAVARITFRSQMVKAPPSRTIFRTLKRRFAVQMSFCVAGATDSAPCQKWAKRRGFVAFPKTMACVGRLKRIWKDAFRMAGAVQETCSERGCTLEHRIFRFKMILRDWCSTSYDLTSLFPL